MDDCTGITLIGQLRSPTKRVTAGTADLRAGENAEKEMVEMIREKVASAELYALPVENQAI